MISRSTAEPMLRTSRCTVLRGRHVVCRVTGPAAAPVAKPAVTAAAAPVDAAAKSTKPAKMPVHKTHAKKTVAAVPAVTK